MGEGLLGLPRALIQAGCATTVVSSWVVNDATACHLMEAFYKHLLRGSTVAPALRFAMLDTCMGDGSSMVCPALWAPFQIVGSPSVRLCHGMASKVLHSVPLASL